METHIGLALYLQGSRQSTTLQYYSKKPREYNTATLIIGVALTGKTPRVHLLSETDMPLKKFIWFCPCATLSHARSSQYIDKRFSLLCREVVRRVPCHPIIEIFLCLIYTCCGPMLVQAVCPGSFHPHVSRQPNWWLCQRCVR